MRQYVVCLLFLYIIKERNCARGVNKCIYKFYSVSRARARVNEDKFRVARSKYEVKQRNKNEMHLERMRNARGGDVHAARSRKLL